MWLSVTGLPGFSFGSSNAHFPVIGYWLLVCAHLQTQQRKSREIRARAAEESRKILKRKERHHDRRQTPNSFSGSLLVSNTPRYVLDLKRTVRCSYCQNSEAACAQKMNSRIILSLKVLRKAIDNPFCLHFQLTTVRCVCANADLGSASDIKLAWRSCHVYCSFG